VTVVDVECAVGEYHEALAAVDEPHEPPAAVGEYHEAGEYYEALLVAVGERYEAMKYFHQRTFLS